RRRTGGCAPRRRQTATSSNHPFDSHWQKPAGIGGARHMEPTDPNEEPGYEPGQESEGQPSQPQDVQTDGEARSETPAPGGGPTVRVEIGEAEGDLRITGGAAQVTLHADHDDISGADRGGVLYFETLPDGAELAVPHGAAVLVRDIHGDLEVDDLDGAL